MHVSFFKNVFEAYIPTDKNDPLFPLSCEWTDLVKILSVSREVNTKESADLRMFNLVKFCKTNYEQYKSQPDKIRRCKNNIELIFGLILDVDNLYSIENIENHLSKFEYYLYTTYSHTPNKNKFRVVLPFAFPATRMLMESRVESLLEWLAVDRASFSMSQSFWLPCHAVGTKPYHHHHQGLYFNLLRDVNTPKPKPKPVYEPIIINEALQAEVLKKLMACDSVRYAQGLTLASICKQYGFTEDDFQALAQSIGAVDSSIRTPRGYIHLWKNAHPQITKVKYDDFIKKHSNV